MFNRPSWLDELEGVALEDPWGAELEDGVDELSDGTGSALVETGLTEGMDGDSVVAGAVFELSSLGEEAGAAEEPGAPPQEVSAKAKSVAASWTFFINKPP